MQLTTPASYQKRLTWVEPKGFRKAELKGSWKSMLRIIGLTAGVAVVFIGIANWFDLGAEVTWKLMVTAGAIVIMCLVLWGGTRLMRIVVKITDKAIVWEFGETQTVYRFETVDHCEIHKAFAGDKTIPELVVALKNGDREAFGVAPSVEIEVLRSMLEQRGVNVVARHGATEEEDLHLRTEHSTPGPFESIVECLKRDGLADQAYRFDELLHHVAWTTGTEMIGELGLEMKRMWPMVKARGSAKTKEKFRSAARLVRRAWPGFRL